MLFTFLTWFSMQLLLYTIGVAAVTTVVAALVVAIVVAAVAAAFIIHVYMRFVSKYLALTLTPFGTE